jgi:myo-inositol-1(or 4)-monophosphatase
MLPDLKKLKEIVKLAAHEVLVPHLGEHDFIYKDDGSVVTKADVAMQERLNNDLMQAWPQYALLGEEMSEQQQLEVINSGATYWCIDPLDGTNNYTAGMPLYAVSIALVNNGVAELGLIYDPSRDEMFTSIKGQGAYLNNEQLVHRDSVHHAGSIVAEIEMKRLPKELAIRLVTDGPYGSHRNSGSSAIDWCWLAAGRFNIYLHGGQKLWDYAAGHLILEETGGKSISLDGEPVFRGKLEARSVLAALDEKLFDDWCAWISVPYQS